ncbi:MAG: hypothetical protein QM687_06425 [Ferruginibacter sp.]
MLKKFTTRISLMVLLSLFIYFAHGQGGVQVEVLQNSDVSFKIGTPVFYVCLSPQGKIAGYGTGDGKAISYDINGRVIKLGSSDVHYDVSNRVYRIGNTDISYDLNNRVIKIGATDISYDINNRVYRIGEEHISYNTDGRFERIGRLGL